MKIALLGNAASVHVQRWAAAYATRGHEVHVLSIRAQDITGVSVHTVSVGKANAPAPILAAGSYARLALSARRRLDQIQPDILHAHYTVTHGAIAALSRFTPRVVTAWGSDVIGNGAGRMPIHRRALNRLALARPSLVTSASRFMAEHARALAGAGVDVVQVPFGVDPNRFKPAETPRPAGPFRVGFVKTLAPRYGPQVLLRAVAEATRGIPDLQVVLAGGGPMRDEIEQQAGALGLRDRLELPGFVAPDRVPDLMRRLDVFVNPTIVPESFGVSVLEASATGVPVIATRVGGVPEVCRDGETGILVPADDAAALARAIQRLHGDPALRAAMGQAGRRMVLADYVWDRSVDLMLAGFARVLGRGRD